MDFALEESNFLKTPSDSSKHRENKFCTESLNLVKIYAAIDDAGT